MKPVNVFVAADGNGFMTDIACWLVEAAQRSGRIAQLVTDRLPSDATATNLVLAPHEFFALNDASDGDINDAAAVSIPVCTEQPGTPWFHIAMSYCRPSPLVLDINPHGVDAVRRERLPVARLALGAVPSMVSPTVERDLDVLFLGGDTPRRRRLLAPLGPVLAEARAELRLFSFSVPVGGATPGLVFGADKYALLARSRILVNIHRDDAKPGYFEWARMVEAMANGCTVVTEPCDGFQPLVPGTHFVTTEDLAGTVQELLDDPARCAAIGATARRAVIDDHPLHRSLADILDRLDGLGDLSPTLRPRREQRAIRKNRIRRAHTTRLLGDFRPAIDMRSRVYRALLDEQRLRREIDAARCNLRHGAPGVITETTTSAYDRSLSATSTPEVSVMVTLFNYAALVTATLDSIMASCDVSLEIVVIDDHSSDDGRDVVKRFMTDHDDVPILLLGREDNHGLAAARNLGIERARADRIMVMDADNLVYPACLRRLSDALDAHPEAAMAYATLEAFGVEPGLRSEKAWYGPWLCQANYIDAQAMVRRSTYERHGGYRDNDDWVYGLEDWDLWLRLLDAGEYGVHVPQMLGRYRTQTASMISVTNLAADLLLERIAARYPNLPWRG